MGGEKPVVDFSEEIRGPDKPITGKRNDRCLDDFLFPPVEALMERKRRQLPEAQLPHETTPGEKKPYAPNNEREMDAFWDFVLAVAVLAGLWGGLTVVFGAILWAVFPMPWWGAVAAGMTPAFIVLWIIMDQNK